MVAPEVVKTRAAIKFCVNLGHTPTETFNLLKIAGDAPAMKKQCSSGTHALSREERALKMTHGAEERKLLAIN